MRSCSDQLAWPQRPRAQDYFRAVRQDVAQTAVKLPVVQGDFFTYADKDQEVELRGEIDNRSMHSPFTEMFSCCSGPMSWVRCVC